jgi:uncharacterized protein YbjT (DUF2867 family)
MIKLVLKIIGGLFLVFIAVIGGLALTLNANPPITTFDVEAKTTGQAADELSSILIFGGTRNTGLKVAQRLTERGDKVTAFVRPTSDRSGLEMLGVDFVVGDAMDIETIREAFAAGSYRAVLTTIGCLSCKPPPDYQANANIVKVAKEAGVRRVVLISTIGAGDSFEAVPWLSKRVLAKSLPMKTRAENAFRQSGLDYTIIRPGGLRSGNRTGNGVLTEEVDVFGFIFRDDLADLIVAVLDDDRSINRTLAAVDANRQWPWSNK